MTCFDLRLIRSFGKWCLDVRGPEWLVAELIREMEGGKVFHLQSSCTAYHSEKGRWVSERVTMVLDDVLKKEEGDE